MTDLREAAQMALNALEWCYDVTEWPANGNSSQDKAIEALRAALAQPEPEPTRSQKLRDAGYTRRPKGWSKDGEEPEPVAWRVIDGEGRINYVSRHKDSAESWLQYDATRRLEPLYTAPPQREWQGLTDEEIDQMVADALKPAQGHSLHDWAIRIEAKLKEKNR